MKATAARTTANNTNPIISAVGAFSFSPVTFPVSKKSNHSYEGRAFFCIIHIPLHKIYMYTYTISLLLPNSDRPKEVMRALGTLIVFKLKAPPASFTLKT